MHLKRQSRDHVSLMHMYPYAMNISLASLALSIGYNYEGLLCGIVSEGTLTADILRYFMTYKLQFRLTSQYALLASVQYGQAACARVLLEAGVRDFTSSALIRAIDANSNDIVTLLVSARPVLQDDDRPLINACFTGNVHAATLLLQKHAYNKHTLCDALGMSTQPVMIELLEKYYCGFLILN